MKNYLTLLLAALLLSACGSKQKPAANDDDKKTIVISTSQKPTYYDMIRYAIQPVLEKKGYTIKILQVSESQLTFKALLGGEVDAHVGGHKAAFNYFEKYAGIKLATLISVPSAHEGLFSSTLHGDLESIKKQLKPGDIVIVPDDPTNMPRSLVFLENVGLLTLKAGANKEEVTEKDIAENPYKLEIKSLNAAQIPRNIDNVALAVAFGDDADLLGILDSAIVREIHPEDIYMNMFVTAPENENKPWIKDLVAAIESEEFKNVIEDPKYRFHRYWRPQWYVQKWGIQNIQE
ncbi:MAG: hypothetical protein LBN27_07350 [Prevotellaceae bacterium]|jgi:D-methionine transport system substrate-binding protein|nr:hypothetical protein [Prevotellaceae bacterium]